MSDDSSAGLIARCSLLDGEEILAVYVHLLGQEDLKHETSIPARALRDKARAGDLADDLVPLLVIALVDAPNLTTFIHLAKALAAFGRTAQNAVPYIIERLEAVPITNDRRFWVFDSGLWVLGFLGGDRASAFVAGLKAEEPSRVLRSQSVYEGELTDDDRAELFTRTLTEVERLLAQDEPGVWREKLTDMGVTASAPGPKRLSPWMTR